MNTTCLLIHRAWAVALAAALAACATTRPTTRATAQIPEYSIGFYNAGNARIDECRADWNENGASHEADAGVVPPGGRAVDHFSQPEPIPQKVTVSWDSADGKHHQRCLEVAPKVPNVQEFSGTIWIRIGENDRELRVVPITYDEQDRLAIEQKPYWPK